MVSDAQILEVLLTEQDLESAVYALIEQANDAGGKDNVTVVLVRVEASKRNVRAKGSRQGWQA
jgi:PPM family protein phosphatase